MASNDATLFVTGSAPAPLDYTVPGTQEITPKSVNALFDGTGASGAFVPTLEIISDGGHVLARVPCTTTIAAGGQAEVTFAPFLRSGATGGLIPPPGPVVDFDAYAVYTGGESGVFIPPLAAKLLLVVCVGPGGGGGGGQRSGANATAGAAGSGGGGGGVAIAWHDCARLAVQYPSGVTFSVGQGGVGPAAGMNGGDGSAPTLFGTQSGGAGGGGTAGATNDVSTHAGSGGGITSAHLATAGTPTLSQSTPLWGIAAAVQRGTGTNPPATEYGGAAGGTRPASSLVIGSNCPGQEGGSSLWGGCGGGGGGSWTNFGTQQGGKGGTAGQFPATNTGSGNGTNSAGLFGGMWTGSGGDGGTAQVGSAGSATQGYDGSIGSGGGGGGGAGLGAAGAGGGGGAGLLIIYAFG